MAKFIIVLLFLPFIVFGQNSEGKVWTELGIKGAFTKKLDWGLEVTNRFGSRGLETFFPQASVKYKLTKWLRPSIEYRSIFKKDKYNNYQFSNRLNLNLEFKHQISRFTGSLRVRYQYSFDRPNSNSKYDAEFDQAIRIKPQINYDINKSIFTPVISLEYFYNPMYGPYGHLFKKYRGFIGVDLDLDSPHNISFGYIYDQELNAADPETKHIFSASYTYDLSFKKEEKKKN